MEETHQISFDELVLQDKIKASPGRTSYIDEYGSFGFDFSTEGASKYYVLCAVIVEDSKIGALHSAVADVKKNNGFAATEMKSSTIGNKYKWRSRIMAQLLAIDFHVLLFIADKREFAQGSPLTNYKKSFIKFLHQRFYDLLYHVYPKLKIIEDSIGSNEFQASFRKYVQNNRPQLNLLNEYDFDYVDSKNEFLVQLADIIGGSIGHSLTDNNSPNYQEMLKGKIIATEYFPNKKEPYWGSANPDNYKYNQDIYDLSVKCAYDFITKYEHEQDDESRVKVAFLRYLLFHVNNVNPTQYVSAAQILATIREYTSHRVTKDFLYRRIIAPLRDEGVIIASCPRGYKIPISAEDITAYLNQTNTRVSPMLRRVGICRNLILQKTDGNLDILNDDAFVKYKRYFD